MWTDNGSSACAEVIGRFCREGLTEQQLGSSYSDNIQTLKVYYQAYQETLADNQTKLSELQAQMPEPEKWADPAEWIMTEGEGIEDVILTHIQQADHRSILPHSVRTLAANLWQVVNTFKGGNQVKKEPTEKGTPETTVADPVVDPFEFPSSVPENAIITLEHNMRFDALRFSDSLNKMTGEAPDIQKPRLIGKAPEIFQWPRNEKVESSEVYGVAPMRGGSRSLEKSKVLGCCG